MIKEAILKFFSNLKYSFMVLGILFFALLIGFSFIYTGTGKVLKNTGTEISSLITSSDLSLKAVEDSIATLDPDRIYSSIEDTKLKFEHFYEDLKLLLQNSGINLVIVLAIFLLIQFIAMAVGHDVVYFKSRYSKAGKPFLTWLKLLIKNIIVLAIIGGILYVYIYLKNENAAIVLACMFPIFYCFMSLLIEWIAAGKGRPKFCRVVSVKNILILLLEDVIIILLSALLGYLLILLFSILVGFYGSITILIVGMATISVNAAKFILNGYTES